ncbi:hypothetical protein NEUTE1DRAFT_143375 [Neurospora tetrasperma FGSC 2508]|uniref:Uncharacterized protein n=1 Tax=Neurospora tetrasperma (strain FGSC 2508 / ATCC MYA-4615 / P0657) TaxID=510951 RepID=F8N532_NEUT8|nr:uncharacterized protein NEUTE1DRAFT_143375 [Neurospora tetrasperma FGSC 2508]EGO53613.1 hypothetical protein NEUTE1DRAFT_143375 [Neurospora tetrasperma FGSC 2508]
MSILPLPQARDSPAASSQAQEQPDLTRSITPTVTDSGISSGDHQLAALVSQYAIACGTNHLRRPPPLPPVTSDAFSGLDLYMPLHFRYLHTSA